LEAKPLGVRQLAAALKNKLERQGFWAVLKSGSKLPHSKGALPAGDPFYYSDRLLT
jgi:hypothetical protein